MTKEIDVIIVEDEFHQRETLAQKLQEYHSEIKIVALCDNAETALVEVIRNQPQLIFLDIQLPGNNGLWLADHLGQIAGDAFTPPAIIFTTAYSDSEYLLKAIRLSAIDYLIKPVQIDSLAVAINRFKKQHERAPIRSFPEVIKKERLFRFKNLGGLLLVKIEDIAYVEGDGNYSKMYLANGEREEIFERLGEIEQSLPSETFIRAGKSIIVNKNYVRRVYARNSTLQIATPYSSYEVAVSAGALKAMRDAVI